MFCQCAGTLACVHAHNLCVCENLKYHVFICVCGGEHVGMPVCVYVCMCVTVLVCQCLCVC